MASDHVLNEAGGHADARTCEADVPVDPLRQIAGDERTEQRAEINPHVEDGEPRVAPRIARRVERADERAHVRLQQSGTEDDEDEAGIEEWKRPEREREVAQRDDDAADQDAAILPEPPVGDDAAEDRRAPRGARVEAVDVSGGGVAESE